MLHGTCDSEVDGLTEGVFRAQGLVIDVHCKNEAHGTTDEGNVALLHGTCDGEVHGLTQVAFWAIAHGIRIGLAHEGHGFIDE